MKIRILLYLLFQISLSASIAQTTDSILFLKEVRELYHEGDALINSLQYDSALVLLKHALEQTKLKLGEDYILAGDIAHTIGYILMVQEQTAEAKLYYLESLRIKRLKYIPPNASLAVTINGLGLMEEREGSFDLAESHFIEARTNWEGSFGRDHDRYSWAQHNLGQLYIKLGREQEAVECLTDALRVKQANLPKDDPDLGHTLVSLSGALFQLGDYAGYEATVLRAAEIWKKQKGIDNLLYYWSRHNLAMLYENLGHYKMAKSYALEALNGKDSIYRSDHPDIASTLTVLATIYSGLQQYDSANIHLLKAKEIYEVNNLRTIEYAWVLNNLGFNCSYMGQYDTASIYLNDALEIKKSILGTQNTDYSSTLLNFIRTLIYKNQFDTATMLLEEQKLFYEERDLTRNENYVTCLDLLGYVHIKLQDPESALRMYQLTNRIYSTSTSMISGFTSEDELFSFLNIAEYYLYKYVSLALHCPEISDADRMDVSNQILFFKGFLLDKYIEIRNQVQWDTSSLRVYHALNAQKKLLYKQLVKIPSERMDTKQIENEISLLERDLSQRVTFYIKHSVETESIRSRLKPDEVAIEFIEYNYYMPDFVDSTFYAAILIHPSFSSPVIIPLFEARQLTQYISETLRHQADYANLLYIKYGKDLYDMIWTPLLPYLAHIRTIYFSSSGLLHRINFNAIPVTEQKVLADEYDLVRMITTSQLLVNEDEPDINSNCILIGGINYEADTTDNTILVSGETTKSGEGLLTLNLPATNPLLRGKDWTYLSGSNEEIDRILPLFHKAGLTAEVWKGNTPTEESFKNLSKSSDRLRSPGIIHLSTHGYFYPDPVKGGNADVPGSNVHMIKSAENPLIRSGLIMAGGNYAWKKGEALRPWLEDGILTAYEIGPMNLSDTKLVVLSACETGLGDIDGNEGVYGLQRAFKIAGVQYIMMSLWQVPDAATSELMTRFYTHLLKKNVSVRKALVEAQKDMRMEGYDPFEWAGFILTE